ncbi:hypothetical protein M5G07_01260 [Serratia symbiotica]|nr:hypothetical protein [Serratia symbiotica]
MIYSILTVLGRVLVATFSPACICRKRRRSRHGTHSISYEITGGHCTLAPPARLQRHTWRSKRLGNSCNVWIYTTSNSQPTYRMPTGYSAR